MGHKHLKPTLLLFFLATTLVAAACQASSPISNPEAPPAATLTIPAFTATPALPTSSPIPTAQALGKLLFVREQEGNYEVYLTNPDGTSLVNLTNHPLDDINPTWSPDGQFIAFSSIRDGKEGIYRMRSDGRQVAHVPNTGPLEFPLGWSPDGQYLLLVSYREVNAELFALKLDDSTLINLSRHPANDWNAAWSPDGSKIAFVSDRDRQIESPVGQIYVMNVDGTDLKRLTDSPTGAYSPVWSPDGKQIAFSLANDVPGQAGRMDVYLMQADGTAARRLTNLPGQNIPQTWSPDGMRLIVTQIMNGKVQSFMVTLEDGTSEPLTIGSTTVRWQPAGELTQPISLPEPSQGEMHLATLALVNGLLIDGTGAEPLQQVALVIQDGRIAALGPQAEVAIPAGARVIDVHGGAILPGFINAHVHAATSARNLAAWAQAGVTTVRSLGEPVGGLYRDWNHWVEHAGDDPAAPFLFAYRDAVLEHPQYARLVAAGPIVSVPDGYPVSYWGPGIDLAITSPEDAAQKVSALIEAGADIIKISLETGPRLSQEEAEAIVVAAHQRGALVTAHIGGTSYLAEGLAAGIDDAAHIATDRWPDELLAQMVADDVYLVPTLAVLSRACGQPGDCLDNLHRFVEAGGKVALGDDYGNPGTTLGMPMRELELMQMAGMTPLQIIVAATQNSAHVCNLEKDLGTLEAGKIADVWVVGGDPLQDIHTLTQVMLVIHNGVVIYLSPTFQ